MEGLNVKRKKEKNTEILQNGEKSKEKKERKENGERKCVKKEIEK